MFFAFRINVLIYSGKREYIYERIESVMAECSHDCESCSENCSSRDKKSFIVPQNQFSQIKKVIGVVSGKGGVGKSLISSMIAVDCAKKGMRAAILDADITGPSIPKMFGLDTIAKADDGGLYPVYTKTGIAVMSLNLLLENKTDPVVWRGPIIGGTVKQFWTDVIWGDVDVMVVDMPPGTGDVPLTVFQSIPVDGIVIVSTPQELVSMIVEKAVKMAKLMEIPVLGMVENMSYAVCPDCGAKFEIFGASRVEQAASENGIEVYSKLPFDTSIAALCDAGKIEDVSDTGLENIINAICK